MIFTCPNGDLVDTRTGIVVGYSDFSPYVPLSKNAQTLLRHFDGMSAEPLGSIPKIITLSRAEEKLLCRLRPWKWFKYATRMDYLRLLDKINRHKLNINMSIQMKVMWADPDSIYNSVEYRKTLVIAQARRWSDPQYLIYWSTLQKQLHPPGGPLAQETSRIMRLWWAVGDRRQVWGQKMSEYFASLSKEEKAAQKRRAWEARRKKYGSSGTSVEGGYSKICKDTWDKVNERGRKRHGEKVRRGCAFRKLAQVMDMLFEGIVDEDAETFPCPHCNRVFSSKVGLGKHTSTHTKLRDLDELELQSYQSMVWAYQINDYAELTAGQRRTLRSSGLIEHKHGYKITKGNVISLSVFGKDVLSTIDANNAPLVRL